MNEKTTSQVLLISAIPAILLMAFLFDLTVSALAEQNSTGAGWEPLLIILYPLFELLIVLGVMSLFWYLFRTEPRSRGASIALTVIGFIVLFSTPLLFFLPFPVSWMALVDFFRPGTFMFQAGAMMGAAGLLSLLIKDRRANDVLEAGASASPAASSENVNG